MSQKSLIIKNLCPGLVERGKIKIGRKGAWKVSQNQTRFQLPEKIDHFLVTTTEKGEDNNFLKDESIHKVIGDKPTRIPVRLLYDQIDLNLQCRYACFKGHVALCTGDGESATKAKGNNEYEDIPCSCERIRPEYKGNEICKVNGTLSVLIDGVPGVGGVWKFRTTGWNSTVGLLSALALIKRISGGPLAGLPLFLTLHPKTAVNPKNSKTVKIWVVGIEYPETMESLRSHGLQIALDNSKNQLQIANIEEEARKILGHDPVGLIAEAEDVATEFYPEEEAPPPIVDPTKGEDGPTTTKTPNVEPSPPGTSATTQALPPSATTGTRKRRTKAEMELAKQAIQEANEASETAAHTTTHAAATEPAAEVPPAEVPPAEVPAAEVPAATIPEGVMPIW